MYLYFTAHNARVNSYIVTSTKVFCAYRELFYSYLSYLFFTFSYGFNV